MSLQSRLASLITAIGADIKAINTALATFGAPDVHNGSTATQTTNNFASDTYLNGSNLAIPTGKIKVGTKVKWKFNVAKTSTNGTAAPVLTVRVGTNGTTADTSRAVMTFAVQTAVPDEGVIEVEGIFRASGSTAVLQIMGVLGHRLAATGLSTANNSIALATSAAFDITGANLKIGLSFNGGSNFVGTVSQCTAELLQLAP